MHTKPSFIRGLSLAMGLSALAAASQPNFSGEWRMDAGRSSFAPLPAPDSLVRKITHQGQRLKMVTTQHGQQGQQREIVTELAYTTDGKPCKNTIRGDEFTGTAKWDGSNLVIDSERVVQGMKIGQRETWMLSGDGQTLTIGNRVQTPQGAFDITIVLEKQQSN
ncbi:MAG TPA: hypothetical protein VKR61_04425 [Bryobacteraceae bacterium]|nr:hypothetical protein [Bryobacteraceae bacterium]